MNSVRKAEFSFSRQNSTTGRPQIGPERNAPLSPAVSSDADERILRGSLRIAKESRESLLLEFVVIVVEAVVIRSNVRNAEQQFRN